MAEPRRSSVLTWFLIALIVIVGAGTTFLVAMPIARCTECRPRTSGPNGAISRRVRIDGEWRSSNATCVGCADRGRVTILTYGLSQAR